LGPIDPAAMGRGAQGRIRCSFLAIEEP